MDASDLIPFRVDSGITEMLQDMDEEDLRGFAEIYAELTDDTNVELYIYSCVKIFEKSNTLKYLDLAIERTDTWITVGCGDDREQTRRKKIFQLLTLRKSNITSTQREGLLGDQVIDVTTESPPQNRIPLIDNDEYYNESILLGKIYEKTKDIGKMAVAVEAAEYSLMGIPPGDPRLAPYKSNLGNRLCQKYEARGNIEDLNRAITLTNESLDATPLDDPMWQSRLNNLITWYKNRFSKTGDIKDFERAIELAGRALASPNSTKEDQLVISSTLSSLFQKRYEKFQFPKDLLKAVKYAKTALDGTPSDSPKRSLRLHNFKLRLPLNESAYQRTESWENMDELSALIEVAEIAVASDVISDAEKIYPMRRLAENLLSRFLQCGSIGDIDRAVDLGERVIIAAKVDTSSFLEYLDVLSIYLHFRFQRTQNMEDVKWGIDIMETAVMATENLSMR
ncbi:hypothetical protein TWF694_006226 [Orbilia ellipsospora]|uniref:Uncharacterized protein n=1 Tax=Orbilia ellipsospora TaxID=2528407 RepID=A0AAV9XJZ0_9PEZI